MFNYRCEKCKKGTVRPRVLRNYRTKVRGFPFVVPEATIGVCDQCAAEYFSGQELARWSELYTRRLEDRECVLSAEEIAELRGELHLSIGDFAVLVGCTRQSVYNWERRDRNTPQSRIADLLLKLLRVSLREDSVDVLRFLADEARQYGVSVRLNRSVATHGRGRGCRAPRLLPLERYSQVFGSSEENRGFPALTDFSTVGATLSR